MTVDYTKFSNNGENQPNSEAVSDRRWWLVNKSDRAQTIAGVIKMIIESDTKRQVQYQISSRLYGNSTLMGVNGISVTRIMTPNSAPKDRITFNVVQSAIDTVTAKIAKNKPKPYFLTSGGNGLNSAKRRSLTSSSKASSMSKKHISMQLGSLKMPALLAMVSCMCTEKMTKSAMKESWLVNCSQMPQMLTMALQDKFIDLRTSTDRC
jgi:hypothetical protein